MRVYFQTDDSEEWFKGELVSLNGGRMVNIASRDDAGKIIKQLTFSNTETLFYGSGFSVTGYLQITDNPVTYKLMSVDFRFSKPRNKV